MKEKNFSSGVIIGIITGIVTGITLKDESTLVVVSAAIIVSIAVIVAYVFLRRLINSNKN